MSGHMWDMAALGRSSFPECSRPNRLNISLENSDIPVFEESASHHVAS